MDIVTTQFSSAGLILQLRAARLLSTVPSCVLIPVLRGQKSDAQTEALGRSKGSFSCKIHALTDTLGDPLRFILTPGQASDIGQAECLVGSISVNKLMPDKGYDSKAFVHYLQTQGIKALIPSRANALEPRQYDQIAYQERHLIECYFGKMKHYRRVFSPFEKKAVNFLDFLKIVAFLI